MNRVVSSLCAALLAGVTFASPQDGQAPFSITLSAAHSVFGAGSEVRIRLVFKNTSGEEIPYGRGPGIGVEPNGELFSDVEVRDAKGEPAPETKYHRVIRGKADSSANPATSVHPEPLPRVHVSVVGYVLKPGESRDEDIVVSKLYDLSKPGQYTISASRRLLDVATDSRSKLVAKSNSLMITVTR